MASFGTTQKCKACDKTVHFAEMMSVDGIPYHKACFKCNNCTARLSVCFYLLHFIIINARYVRTMYVLLKIKLSRGIIELVNKLIISFCK